MSEVLENLKKTLLEYDKEGCAFWANKAIEEGIGPIKAFDVLAEAMKEVGNGYGRGELWLPDLIGAATTFAAARPILEEKIKEGAKKRQSLGTIVIGTVNGDIHDIGKNMVSVLAMAEGFNVIDLGVDVPADKFINAVKANEADILAMSSLLTTTMHVQKEIIQSLKKTDLGVKIAVGGGAITQEFADMIGADGYGPTAVAAPKLFKELLGLRE